MKIEKPAKFTLVRLLLIPLFMLFMVYDFGLGKDFKYTWPRIISASFFIMAVVSYYIDKKLMGRRGDDTGYWRFLDMVADKLVIFGALIAICFSGYILPSGFYRHFFFWAAVAVMLRELAVIGIGLTDSQLDVKGLFKGGDTFRSTLFKSSNAAQMVWIIVVVLEPVLKDHKLFYDVRLLSLIVTVLAVTLSIYSGLYCVMMYKKHIDFLNED
ncbi:MAG: hypothetical protein IJB65_04850 [Clostridia bacterium]|nr:hypothetical protein [Clostridia bacterium]